VRELERTKQRDKEATSRSIPQEWSIVTIDKLTRSKDDIKTGPFGSSLKKEIFVAKGYKVYGQENVIPDEFSIGNYYISEDVFLKMRKYEIKPKDILISLVGTHGKVSLVPENIERSIINPRLLKITLNQSIALPEFMKILLTHEGRELHTDC
jgi:type I restriction enzyme, S subunit